MHPVLRRLGLWDPGEPDVRAAPACRLDECLVGGGILVDVGAEDGRPEPGQDQRVGCVEGNGLDHTGHAWQAIRRDRGQSSRLLRHWPSPTITRCLVRCDGGSIGEMGEGSSHEDRLEAWGSGSKGSKASRRAGVVYRDPGPQSQTVLAFLRHLENVGFAGAPKVVGDGFAPDGREMLSYLEGSSPHPGPWAGEAIAAVGELLRDLHAAAATFAPPPGATWKQWFGRELPGSLPVFGHCDTGPWNIIARAGRPVALVDFEFAGPVDAVWELAQAAWLNAQLHDDDVAERCGLADAAARAGQLKLILDGYGLAGNERDDFVDKMITFAVHDARAEAVNYQVTPATTTGVSADGYPFAWAIAWRVRSASWMLANRSLLQRAIA